MTKGHRCPTNTQCCVHVSSTANMAGLMRLLWDLYGKSLDIKDAGLQLFADQAGPDVIPSQWQDDEQDPEDHHDGHVEVGDDGEALLVHQILK